MSEATPQDANKIDNYQLINCIATGKFSQVWEAMEEGTPNRVAMKLLLPEYTKDREQVQSLKWETKVGKLFEHPNLVTYHKVVAKKENAYMLMDLFRSLNLKGFIATDLFGVQLRLRKLVESVCMALSHIHDKGWVHRDVKPDNILLNKASEVKLIDFSLSSRAAGGLAKLLGRGTRQIQGTRTYIAPETIKKQPATQAVDIYSFGVTLFEVLTGSPPFTGNSPNDLLRKHLATKPPAPSDLNPNVTPEMDRLVLRMLAKKPKDRPESFQEIFGEFRGLKPFKEDIEELIARKKQEDEIPEDSLSTRRDSRADAQRSGSPENIPPEATPSAVAKPTEPSRASTATARPKPAVPAQTQPVAKPSSPATAVPPSTAPTPTPAPASPSQTPVQPSRSPAPARSPQQPDPSPPEDDDLPLMDELPPII